jgi:imidazole glycerol-phosphate synthase subunit HisF
VVKRRLIPKLLLRSSQFGSTQRMVLVTTVNYDRIINAGDPVSQAKIYEAQSADELIFLNINPSQETKSLVLNIIRKVSEEIFMPITIGGGISKLDDFRELLSNGADKVSINTEAVLRPELISMASARFGAQCVVVSIDYKEVNNKRTVYINGGKTPTELDALDWALQCETLGAGEILVTNIGHDGKQEGLDTRFIEEVSSRVKIPVIASGGCGLAKHFIEGFRAGADAVSAGTFFCFKDQSPIQTRSHISNAGIPIRLHK